MRCTAASAACGLLLALLFASAVPEAHALGAGMHIQERPAVDATARESETGAHTSKDEVDAGAVQDDIGLSFNASDTGNAGRSLLQSSSCSRPSWWCVGATATNVDCGDGDKVLDWACTDASGNRGAILSSRSCATDNTNTGWPTASRTLCPASFIAGSCTRPTWWCTGTGKATNLDCNSDGKYDWTCEDGVNRGVILSKLGCATDDASTGWPSAPYTMCPPRWKAPPPAPPLPRPPRPPPPAPPAPPAPITQWRCRLKSVPALVGDVTIVSGFTAVDASLACNNRLSACSLSPGGCDAVTVRDWSCYTLGASPLNVGAVSIWWGFTAVDASWACNQWIPACGGNCNAVPAGYAGLLGSIFPVSYFVNSDIHIGRDKDPDDGSVAINTQVLLEKVTTVMNQNFLSTSTPKSFPFPTGWVVNGDLTEYFQVKDNVNQPDRLLQLLNPVEINQYRGMGNHDFGNNLDDCTYQCGGLFNSADCFGVSAMSKFGCAARAIREFLWEKFRWRNKIQPNTVVALDKMSGAYHWMEGGWSFIMLGRNPRNSLAKRCYQNINMDVTGCNCNCDGQFTYEIQSTIDNGWLAAQLQDATNRGRRIILFMHQLRDGAESGIQDSTKDPVLADLLRASSVVGIFSGHTHVPEWLDASEPASIAGVPLINTGAVWYNMFLQATFAYSSYGVRVVDTTAAGGAGDWMAKGKQAGPPANLKTVNNVQITYTLALNAAGLWKVQSKSVNLGNFTQL